jgi:hypothetical protein
MKVGDVVFYENYSWEVKSIYVEDAFNSTVTSTDQLHSSEIKEARVRLSKLNVEWGSQSANVFLTSIWNILHDHKKPGFWNPDDLVPSKLK